MIFVYIYFQYHLLLIFQSLSAELFFPDFAHKTLLLRQSALYSNLCSAIQLFRLCSHMKKYLIKSYNLFRHIYTHSASEHQRYGYQSQGNQYIRQTTHAVRALKSKKFKVESGYFLNLLLTSTQTERPFNF